MVLVLHCFFLCDHCSLFLGFLCFSLLSLVLHCITFMHFILGLFYSIYIYKKKKKKKREDRKEKGSTLCFCIILFVFKNKVGQFIFTWHVYYTLFSFDEFIHCTSLVEALLNMLCGKDVYSVYHFVFILKSHAIWL